MVDLIPLLKNFYFNSKFKKKIKVTHSHIE